MKLLDSKFILTLLTAFFATFLIGCENLNIRQNPTDAIDGFGYSIDAGGGYLVIGEFNPISGNDGRVYVFDVRYGNIYSNPKILLKRNNSISSGHEFGDEFGKKVSISNDGNVIAVNAHNGQLDSNSSNTGGAYIFLKNPEKEMDWWLWSLRDVSGANDEDRCGDSLDVASNVAGIGCPGWGGRVSIFDKNLLGNHSWMERKQVMRTQPIPNNLELNIGFGNEISITNEWLAVADNCTVEHNENSCDGYILIYRKDKDGPNQWGLTQTITVTSPELRENTDRIQRISIDIRNEQMLIGNSFESSSIAPGLLFEYKSGSWRLEQKLEPPSNPTVTHSLGYNVSIKEDGQQLILSAVGPAIDYTIQQGLGVVYEKKRNRWVYKEMLRNDHPVNNQIATTENFVFLSNHESNQVQPYNYVNGNWVKLAPITL